MDWLQQKALDIYKKNSGEETHKAICVDGFDFQENIIKDDSAYNTILSILRHKEKVKSALTFLSQKLLKRAENHDNSKLKEPEIGWLIAMDKEPFAKYGTPEYFEKMKRWDKFFLHHYEHNSHHPDHFRMQGFENGLDGMNVLDLLEFLADIISYCDVLRPEKAFEIIEGQSKRFNLSPQLVNILKNTLIEYFTWLGDYPSEFARASLKGKD